MRYVFWLLVLVVWPCVAEDGKIWLRSEPPGAEVIENGKVLGKTACMVVLPIGKHVLSLQLKGYVTTDLDIEPKDNSIMKPDIIKLEPIPVKVDIMFTDEFAIQIDNKPQIVDGKQIFTPATLKLPIGPHEVKLTKAGFQDIVKQINVVRDMVVEINEKSVKSDIKLADVEKKEMEKQMIGKWKMTTSDGWKGVYEFAKDGVCVGSTDNWALKDKNTLVITSGDIVRNYILKPNGTFVLRKENGVLTTVAKIKE